MNAATMTADRNNNAALIAGLTLAGAWCVFFALALATVAVWFVVAIIYTLWLPLTVAAIGYGVWHAHNAGWLVIAAQHIGTAARWTVEMLGVFVVMLWCALFDNKSRRLLVEVAGGQAQAPRSPTGAKRDDRPTATRPAHRHQGRQGVARTARRLLAGEDRRDAQGSAPRPRLTLLLEPLGSGLVHHRLEDGPMRLPAARLLLQPRSSSPGNRQPRRSRRRASRYPHHLPGDSAMRKLDATLTATVSHARPIGSLITHTTVTVRLAGVVVASGTIGGRKLDATAALNHFKKNPRSFRPGTGWEMAAGLGLV